MVSWPQVVEAGILAVWPARVSVAGRGFLWRQQLSAGPSQASLTAKERNA